MRLGPLPDSNKRRRRSRDLSAVAAKAIENICVRPGPLKSIFMSAPASYPPLSPTLVVDDAAAAIDFYQKAFGAEELYRLIDPENGKIGHAEITIRGVLVMLAEEYAGITRSPRSLGGTSVNLGLMSADARADIDRAVAAGAEVLRPLADQFYGHRAGRVRDPFGHEWIISQEIEKLSPEEMQRRWNAMVAEPGKTTA
jgi:PhnB protein